MFVEPQIGHSVAPFFKKVFLHEMHQNIPYSLPLAASSSGFISNGTYVLHMKIIALSTSNIIFFVIQRDLGIFFTSSLPNAYRSRGCLEVMRFSFTTTSLSSYTTPAHFRSSLIPM